MEKQNYKNHVRYVPGFHIITLALALLILVLSVISLFQVWNGPSWLRGGVIPVLMSVFFLFLFWYVRSFPVAVQNRAIRAEENFRYYVMTGKQLDPRLTMGQIIALRFASDEEYIALTERAIKEQLKPAEIKQSIKNWRADHLRC
jgi:hypothetical protein